MIRSKPLPSRTYLRECFDYDLMSGVAIWLERPINHFSCHQVRNMWNSKFAYGQVGNLHKLTGYYHTSINRETYTVHRLIWKWWYGTDPLEIDHIDRCRTNNRIVNLRSVTNHQNTQNRTLSKNNTSGHSGVTYNYGTGRWIARTHYKSERVYLGNYNTVDEAVEAIKEFKKYVTGL